jgi:3-hydroxyisobutyrate dehydrogenase
MILAISVFLIHKSMHLRRVDVKACWTRGRSIPIIHSPELEFVHEDAVIKVGFVGLGRIGKPMAVNILKAGFDLCVHDLRSEPVRELTELGAKAAHSLKELAKAADVIELAVVDDAQVEEALVGDQALIEEAASGTVVVIHSTVYPETVKKVARIAAAKGVHVIDAPISGGETGARERSLCYMVGGDETLVERCREVFSTSASEIFHMGALGSGAAAKMIVQVVTCINMLAAHEAELLAERSGLDFAALQKVLRVSSAQSLSQTTGSTGSSCLKTQLRFASSGPRSFRKVLPQRLRWLNGLICHCRARF